MGSPVILSTIALHGPGRSSPINFMIVQDSRFAAACLFLISVTGPGAAATLTAVTGPIGSKPNFVLKSPDGKLEVLVGLAAEDRLAYAIRDGRDLVLPPSPLGLTVDGVDLGKPAKFSGKARSHDIRESYPLLGNHPQAENHASEAVIPVETAGKQFNLIVRVQNDGVGVRYSLPDGAEMIQGEATSWTLPETTGKIVWAGSSNCYEALTQCTTLDKISEGMSFNGPVTVESAGRYLSFSEADCVTFSDMAFVRRGNSFQAAFPWQGKGWKIVRNGPETRAGVPDGTYQGMLVSPWRTTVVARNLTELVNSDLLMNLCPPPATDADFSWVKPGRCLWQWWSVGEPKYADQQNWYDAAATLKWEYYLIDDGWRTWKQPGKDNWALLKEVIDYGTSKGVKTLIWVDSKEMRDPKSRRAYLEKVRASGATGIKIDFIPAATAGIMQWYMGAMKDCADLKLAVNFHGSVKPTGLRRTFPHDITREAVRGNEWHMTRYKRVAPPGENCLLPFSRFLAGPADITPVMMDPVQLRGYTWPNQLAQAVVFLSPITHFGDQYKFYVGSPFEDLLQELPTVWDETRVLSCTEIGEVVGFARRKGDTWWVGVMNAGTEREVKVSFDFLKKTAAGTLLDDVAGKDDAVDRKERDIAPGEVLTMKLRPRGGFVVRLKTAGE